MKILDNKNIQGTLENHNGTTKIFVYGTKEDLPNISKNNYFELCTYITKHLLQQDYFRKAIWL